MRTVIFPLNTSAYANLAWAAAKRDQLDLQPVLFDNSTPFADLGGLTEFQYLQTHWVYSDYAQFWTGSAGLAYQFCGRPARRDEIFASYTAAVQAFSGGTNKRRPIAAPLSSFTRYSATNYDVYRSSRQSATAIN